ncbi:MAG TPA: 5-methyltetrahydropteroyltriglutamate--homocysteine S-methyltransferase [Solirubrobacteraceae bacterium]|jgi:5-methyltetrahydropteroyltriglutamate--homocysteine methyltransferase
MNTTDTQVASGRRTTPPFRADHVGSLLRPRRLLEARDDLARGSVTAPELRRIEDEEITKLVQMQRDVGLQSATDGELRRGSWHMDFIYQLGGIEKVQGDIEVHFRNADGTVDFKPAAIAVTEKVRLDHAIFEEDFRFLESLTGDGVTPKLTIPSPNMVHYRSGRAALDPDVYPDIEPFWADLQAAYAEQIAAVAALGCRYLQLDDTSLAYLNDPSQREYLTARGEDTPHLLETYIRNINNALAGRPQDLTITTHLCRGNFRSSWAAEGSYEYVAETLFGRLDVDGFFLEFDDERSGGFEPLRFVPPGKMVVLGLVTTKRPELEDKDELRRRIEEAARYVSIDQLCLSPQCGFSSTLEGNALTYDEQKAKLELVVETAAEVWG